MVARAVFTSIVFVFVSSQLVRAQGLSKSDCGAPPQQLAPNESTDTKIGGGISGFFKQLAVNGNYEKAVTTTRQEVYSRYPNADKLDRLQYADYVTCVLIVTDTDLNGEGRRKAWAEYLGFKNTPPTSTNPPAHKWLYKVWDNNHTGIEDFINDKCSPDSRGISGTIANTGYPRWDYEITVYCSVDHGNYKWVSDPNVTGHPPSDDLEHAYIGTIQGYGGLTPIGLRRESL